MNNKNIKVRSIDTERKTTEKGYTYEYIRIRYDHPRIPLDATHTAGTNSAEGDLLHGLDAGGIYKITYYKNDSIEHWLQATKVLPADQ